MKNKKSSYEDLQNNIRALTTSEIEVWENKYSDRDYTVHLSIPECTCICPKTGLPDFVTIHVTYGPDKMCVELKSLKMYIIAFRNVGIFHEHLANKVLDDLVAACRPRWAKVEGVASPRGGITTTVTAEYREKRSSHKVTRHNVTRVTL